MPKNRVLITKGAACQHRTPPFHQSRNSVCRRPSWSAGDDGPRRRRGAPRFVSGAPGLLAVSLGLLRMFADDLEQLNAGFLLYDAFYRWCRDATKETHNRPTNKVK